jgi:hypothetical protein
MSDLCFLSVFPTKPGQVSIKEIGLLWVDSETLEPLMDSHFVVDDPEAVRGHGEAAERGGSLDEALARALPLLEGGVLAGFAVGLDWMLLQGAYVRQGLELPRIAGAMDVSQLAWPLRLRGGVTDLNFSSVALALGISVPGDARSRVYATRRIAKQLLGEARLGARLNALNWDERAIACKAIGRLEQGREEYGPWNVNDGRDYRGEALEEAMDGFLYCAAGLVAAEDGFRDTLPALPANDGGSE